VNKKEVLAALQKARDQSKSRKFEQSVDLTINFKGLDFKKAENRLDVEVKLPHSTGAKGKSSFVVFVKDKPFATQLKEIGAEVILEEQIEALSKNKKKLQELIASFDVLLAEGPAMITVGKFLGQALAPKGKMPKPVPANVNAVKSLVESAATSTRISNKKGKFMPVVHLSVGKEKMPDEQLTENILTVYEAIESKLEGKKNNVKSVFVKLTMGPPIKIYPLVVEKK